tara:strand:- start:7374 stop:7979 length:606 start_codon:yes stop_codon:yes gene_type:complete
LGSNVSKSQFWDDCYVSNNIGWDLGDITPVFKDWAQNIPKKSKILVPGAGNGYDPLYFSSLGHEVLAVDFSKQAIKRIEKEAKKYNLSIKALKCDFFDLESKLYNNFDYIVEYTFFCAIDPINRLKYIDHIYNLLKRSGYLVGLFLPLNKSKDEGGPPFSVSEDEIINNFSNKFKLVKSFKHPLSIKSRLLNEQYFEFKKI